MKLHALGLKHPFAADRSNTTVLSQVEDSTYHTVMSYDEYFVTFDGMFRDLDLVTLVKLYGINPEYYAGNNIYAFSSTVGSFIIDGGGIDTIDMTSCKYDIYLDLRPGSHSFVQEKSQYITSPNQLTISHGTDIEIAISSGDDIIIGNNLIMNYTH